MSERLVLSPAASRTLAALSRALIAAWRTSTLYPPAHPVARGAIDRVLGSLKEAAQAGVADCISVTPTTLYVHGAPAVDLNSQDAGAIAELASLLHGRGILEIGFDADVVSDAVVRLLTLLAASTEPREAVETWKRDGHPAVRLEAIDYRSLLEDDKPQRSEPRTDEVWLRIVAALRSGRRTFDEREQERLLALAGDARHLAALAETITAEQCLPDGSALVRTQAATVLSCFRHLASVLSVVAPERADAIRRNLLAALLQLEPHVAVEFVSLDRQAKRDDPDSIGLGVALDEETVSHLLANLALDRPAAPRLTQVFELLVPDHRSRRRVLDRARSLAAGRSNPSGCPLDAVWNSIEELLGSYDDEAFVSDEYRVVLDSSGGSQPPGAACLPELDEWLPTVGDEALRRSALTMLIDVARLETAPDRVVITLNQLGDLADELLLAGAFDEALEVLIAIVNAGTRDGLGPASAQVLERIGVGAAVTQTVSAVGELDAWAWPLLQRCYLAIGSSVLGALGPTVATEEQTVAAVRAGEIFVASGDTGIVRLAALLTATGNVARARIAGLLGQIGGRAVVPPLQTLLRARDASVLSAALASLSTIDDPAAARALHLVLRTDTADRRQLVVNALVAVGDRRVVPMLMRVLRDCEPLRDDYQVALDTLDALGRLHDPRAVAAIEPIMQLRSWRSRGRLKTLKRSSVEALTRIGDRSALAALERASRTGDRMLRNIIRTAAPSWAGVA